MNSYTHALYMSGAVVVAGACIPFLLLFAKTKEPAASETWKLNEIKETGSVTMIADAEEEIDTEPNSNRITVVFTSSV